METLQALLPDSVIDVRRFRPNILVDFPEEDMPTPEDVLIGREFRIGGLRLRGARPCGRCSVTTFAQHGLPEDRAVLRTLISRFEQNLGIYCDVLDEGDLVEGDALVAEIEKASPAPIVIVGAGQAGAMTARSLRDLGATSAIEVFGDERHTPYERPSLSKPEFREDELASALSAREAQKLDVALHLGTRVTRIDREERVVETDDGLRHPYSRLVIATGGTARRVPRLGRGHGRIHTIRTIEDAQHLYRRLTASSSVFVLGGGWLGLELASVARNLGREVTLFARQRRLCARVLPAAVSDFLVDLHASHGVRFRLGEEPTFAEHEHLVEVTFGGRVESADMLVVAIGMVANDGLARGAGLPCADGVLTDPNGVTEDPNVFAVGDVARRRTASHPEGLRIESWHSANDQAHRVARHLLGYEGGQLPPPRFWSHQYDAMLQVVGLPDPLATPVRAEGGSAPYWEFDGFAIGVNQPKRLRDFAAKLNPSMSDVRPTSVIATDMNPDPQDLISLRLGRVDAVVPGEITRFVADRVGAVAVTRRGDEFLAVQDKCPHADASLSEGFLEHDRIVCPLHLAEFDLRNGMPHNAPAGCPAVTCYRVKRVGDDLFVLVRDTGG